MKKYRVYYWKEINDEAVDLSKEIKAFNEEEVLIKFKLQTRVYMKNSIKVEEII